MAKAPLHKNCGTAHWSTEPCPALKSLAKHVDKVVKERGAKIAKPDPKIAALAEKRIAEAVQQTVDEEAQKIMDGTSTLYPVSKGLSLVTVPKRTKKPAKAKKPKPGSRVTKPRAVKAPVKASPGCVTGKAAPSSSPNPKKMSVPELVAYVTADLKRKAAAKVAKAEAQARWRGKQ